MLHKFRVIFCALFRHSRIGTSFIGYQYCGRCRAMIGDTLSGTGCDKFVSIDHLQTGLKCCTDNYKHMNWLDKFMVKHSVKKEKKEKKEDNRIVDHPFLPFLFMMIYGIIFIVLVALFHSYAGGVLN